MDSNHYKGVGVIEESDSIITLKGDDGRDLTLTLLKHPISLDGLIYDEVCPKATKNKPKRKPSGANKKVKDNRTVSKNTVSNFDIKEDSPIKIDVNVKIYEPSGRGRWKRKVDASFEAWKEHTLAIFQNSLVCPFVHSINKYKCFICSIHFLEAFLLRKHTVEEHTLQDMDRALDNKARDMTLKVDVTCLQCTICSTTLSTFQDLKYHLKEHGENINMDLQDCLVPIKLEDKTCRCLICGEIYITLRLLIVHMKRHYRNFSCEICGNAFLTRRLLMRHLQTHQSGSFPCEKCDKVFSNTAKRLYHMRGVHEKMLPSSCPLCSERFNCYYQRKRHLRVVHNRSTNLHSCDTCGKEFELKCHLQSHTRRVHLQERKHECKICHSQFFAKSHLNIHMAIHTGEKKFKCGICEKAFFTNKSLQKHSKTHAVKEGCNICGDNNCVGHASVNQNI